MPRPAENEPDPKTPEGQVALWLRHLMAERKLNADKLALKSKVSRATIFNWLSGVTDVPVKKFPKLAKALGLVDWREMLPPKSFTDRL